MVSHELDAYRPDEGEDVRRSFTVEQQRVLYWRLTTGFDSHLEAAEIGGVSDRTIRRWLGREDFKAAWDDPNSWAKVYVRNQRAGLELKSIWKMHLLLDDTSGAVSPGTQAEVAKNALQDIRQVRAGESDAQLGQVLRESFERWAKGSAAMLRESEDD